MRAQRLSRRRCREEERSNGQAMVEFALVAPILFLLILATIEAGRFILHYELVNNATREGARFAIVHGSRSACPSGPPPPGEVNDCDLPGDNIRAAVRDVALDLAGSGGLVVHDPVWTSRGRLSNPQPGDASTGHNGRGEYVSVFVDYTYDPILEDVFGVSILPDITVSAESTLVINN